MLKIRNWYIQKESRPTVGQLVICCYDKLVGEDTPLPYYVYTERRARYLGQHRFSFQKEDKWSAPIDLAQFPMDRYFAARTTFVLH